MLVCSWLLLNHLRSYCCEVDTDKRVSLGYRNHNYVNNVQSHIIYCYGSRTISGVDMVLVVSFPYPRCGLGTRLDFSIVHVSQFCFIKLQGCEACQAMKL